MIAQKVKVVTCRMCSDDFLCVYTTGPMTLCGDECRAAWKKKRGAENRAANPTRNAEWKKANADRHKAQRREYYERNRETIMQNVAEWQKQNRDQANRNKAVACAVRRTRISNDPDTRYYAKLVMQDPCSYCGKPSEAADHIDALSMGGLDTWENLTGACKSCNSQKHTTPLLQWMLRKLDRAESSAP